MTASINVKKLRDNAVLPEYQTDGSAGADIYACLDAPVNIPPGGTAAIPSGFALELPPNHAGFVYARSGLATKRDLAPANLVGVIDSDYRGEVTVVLRNFGHQPQEISPGERVAQLIIAPVLRAEFAAANDLTGTERGSGGFGSTGK